MKLKCYIVCVITLSTLITHSVQGFRLNDITEVQTPANAIVQVALEELDADKDGKIAISEVENRIDGFYNSHVPGLGGRPRPIAAGSYSAEMTGYLLTLANLADADISGFIERNEIHRFASHLVNLAGVVQVGRMVDYAAMINARTHGYRYVPELSISQIRNGVDSNSDGQISETEKGELIQLQRFNRWWRDEITETFANADANSDGALNTEEADQWTEQLSRDFPRLYRDLAVYYRIVVLAGRDVANVWINTRH